MRNPFIAGRWVTGPHFFGRRELIKDLIHSHENCQWVIGKRRVGKTSLLRQIEAEIHREGGGAALFWDIQGSYDASGLLESLHDAVEDARDMFPDVWEGIDFQPNTQNQCHQTLKQLVRSVHRHHESLVILIDEAEELINIGRNDTELLGKLRKVLQHTAGLRTVLCSTTRLEQLHQLMSLETSPFLHGFESHFLGHLSRDETLALIAQGMTDLAQAEEISTLTEGNPFETQLIAKHVFDNSDIESVCFEMETNPSLIQVIEVNFDLLTDQERDIIKDVFCGKSAMSLYTQQVEKSLISRLEKLGYLTVFPSQTISVCSHFVRKWLEARFDHSPAFHAKHVSDEWLGPQHQEAILRQLPSLYKCFIDWAADQKRMVDIHQTFRCSGYDGTIYPDRDTMMEDGDFDQPNWRVALDQLMTLIRTFVQTDLTWTLHRILQMADDTQGNYTETDFLDLMMLISEEMELA
ncbi:MAG: ATP-binding protein [Acidobacteria bacterium]|nr:ATP-binding protein [Acidobacteriota bacterium]